MSSALASGGTGNAGLPQFLPRTLAKYQREHAQAYYIIKLSCEKGVKKL